jgi:7-cyano-7-deazaguanine reductase
MNVDSVLQKTIRHAIDRLETFPAPVNVTSVIMVTDEGTSVCPETSQPDFWSLTVEYIPSKKCIESKSLKLYAWKFREAPIFCEALSNEIAQHIMEVVEPLYVKVTVNQKPRGGIGIIAISEINGQAEYKKETQS